MRISQDQSASSCGIVIPNWGIGDGGEENEDEKRELKKCLLGRGLGVKNGRMSSGRTSRSGRGQTRRGTDRRQRVAEPVLAPGEAFAAGEAELFGAIDRRRKPRRKEDVRRRVKERWDEVRSAPIQPGPDPRPDPVVTSVPLPVPVPESFPVQRPDSDLLDRARHLGLAGLAEGLRLLQQALLWLVATRPARWWFRHPLSGTSKEKDRWPHP
jgi:hypothetical protein